MRKGGIMYNGVEDEVRCMSCGFFFASVKPKLEKGQQIHYECKKCGSKGIVKK